MTKRDRTAAFAFPASAAANRKGDEFLPSDDLCFWGTFRDYVERRVSRLRSVGFRLARKEPPSLDVRDVFVPLDVEVLDSREIPSDIAEAARKGVGLGPELLEASHLEGEPRLEA